MAMHLSCSRMHLSSSRAAFARPARMQQRLVAARRPAAANRLVVRASVGSYLAEAAAFIFSPKNENEPDWGSSSFSGEITHHNEVAKLRKLHQAVKATRQKVAGCTDATATNYDANAVVDDGTCEYIISKPGAKEYKGTVADYISGAVVSVFGQNFTNSDKARTADFDNTTFSYGGDKVSQRDIQRLLSFEQVVKKTLDTAEKQVDEA